MNWNAMMLASLVLLAGLLSSASARLEQPAIHSRQLMAATFAMGTATEESLFIVSKDGGSASSEIEGSSSVNLSIDEEEAESESESESDITIAETTDDATFAAHTQVEAVSMATGADTVITATHTTSGQSDRSEPASSAREDEDETPAFGSTFAMGIADAIALGDDSETETSVKGSGAAHVEYESEDESLASISEILAHGETSAGGVSDDATSSYSTFTIEQDVEGEVESAEDGGDASGLAQVSLTGNSGATGDVTFSDSEAKGATQSFVESLIGTTDEAAAMGEAAVSSKGMSFNSPAGSGFVLESNSGAGLGESISSGGAVGVGGSGSFSGGKAVGYSEGKFTDAHASLSGVTEADFGLTMQFPLLLGSATGALEGVASAEDHEIGVGYSSLAKVEGETSSLVDLYALPDSASGMGIGGGLVTSEASGIHTTTESGTGGSGNTLLFTAESGFELSEVLYATAGGEGATSSEAEGTGYSTSDSGTSAGGSVSSSPNDADTGSKVVSHGDAYTSSDARGSEYTYTQADAAGYGHTFALAQSDEVSDLAATQGSVDVGSGTEAFGSRYGVSGSDASALGISQSEYGVPANGDVLAGTYTYLEADAGGYGRAVNSGAGIDSIAEADVLSVEPGFIVGPHNNAFGVALGGSSAFGSTMLSANAQKYELGSDFDSYVSVDGGSAATAGLAADAEAFKNGNTKKYVGLSGASGFASGSGGGTADTKGDTTSALLEASGSGNTEVASGAFALNEDKYGNALFTVAVGESQGGGDAHVRASAEGESVLVEGGAGGSGYAGTVNDAIPSVGVVVQNGDYGKGFSGANVVTIGDETYVNGGSEVSGSTNGYSGYERYSNYHDSFSSGSEQIEAESEGGASFIGRGPNAVGWSDTSAMTHDDYDTAMALLFADSEAVLYGEESDYMGGFVEVGSDGDSDAVLTVANHEDFHYPGLGASTGLAAGQAIGFGFGEQLAEANAFLNDYEGDVDADASNLALAAALAGMGTFALETYGLAQQPDVAYAKGAMLGGGYEYPQIRGTTSGVVGISPGDGVNLVFNDGRALGDGMFLINKEEMYDQDSFIDFVVNEDEVRLEADALVERGGSVMGTVSAGDFGFQATGVGYGGAGEFPSTALSETDLIAPGGPEIDLVTETQADATAGVLLNPEGFD